MKNKIMLLLLASIITVLSWTGCQKDKLSNTVLSTQSPNDQISERDGKIEEISKATLNEILNFKLSLDEWRKGQNISKDMSATDATYQMESVFNYYVGESTRSYAEDFHFYDSVSIGSTSAVWTATQIASLFESAKAKVVAQYSTIAGTDKGIRLIDLSVPVVANGATKVYIYVNAGKTLVPDPTAVVYPTEFTKWGIQGIPTSCGGLANEKIGLRVNSLLGFYLKNDSPNAPGNPLITPLTVVLNPVKATITNVTGLPPLPGGPTVCEYTFTDFLSGTTETDPFPTKGQYKIHYDLNSNENCFSPAKVTNYVIGNLSVGNQIRNECVSLKPNLSEHRVVATYVLELKTGIIIGGFPVLIQAHPTLIYYGKVMTLGAQISTSSIKVQSTEL
jgi:hypothetical protein